MHSLKDSGKEKEKEEDAEPQAKKSKADNNDADVDADADGKAGKPCVLVATHGGYMRTLNIVLAEDYACKFPDEPLYTDLGRRRCIGRGLD